MRDERDTERDRERVLTVLKCLDLPEEPRDPGNKRWRASETARTGSWVGM